MSTSALDSMPLGKVMPCFKLVDVVTQENFSSAAFQEKFPNGSVIIFLCNHCPYVKHLLEGISDMAEAFLPQGIGFVGISANDPTDYPYDGPEGLREMAAAHEIPFPILFDETQEVARAFEVICTPDFFVFDADTKLFYHGRFDGSTHKNGIPMTGEDLKEALEAVLKGGVPSCSSLPSLGCSIKWKLS
ncbi:MAG: thioredoxin family protein [Verrucomicrobiae bacterium]|nr:thioredoxin family protein [Verrucomicrobiae bacterium]